MRRQASRRSGMTLVELVFAVSIAGVLLGSMAMVSESSTGVFHTGMALTRIENNAQSALWKIEQRFRTTNWDNFFPRPAAPDSTPLVDYQRTLGFADPLVEWGDPERIVLEYSPGEIDDGVDNDGNGLVDECRVVLIERPGQPDERRRVLCSGVMEFMPGELPGNFVDDNRNGLEDERGLAIDVAGNQVTIRLALEARSPQGDQLVRQYSRTVTFRTR